MKHDHKATAEALRSMGKEEPPMTPTMKPGTEQAFRDAFMSARIRIDRIDEYRTSIEFAHKLGDLADVLRLTECMGVAMAELRKFIDIQQGLGEKCGVCGNTMAPTEAGTAFDGARPGGGSGKC